MIGLNRQDAEFNLVLRFHVFHALHTGNGKDVWLLRSRASLTPQANIGKLGLIPSSPKRQF
jgi:hypothetical protein